MRKYIPPHNRNLSPKDASICKTQEFVWKLCEQRDAKCEACVMSEVVTFRGEQLQICSVILKMFKERNNDRLKSYHEKAKEKRECTVHYAE